MRRFIFNLLIILCLCACDPAKVYESNIKIPASGWSRNDIARFEVDIPDVMSSYNLYINVRNNNNYKYSDFWLFVDTHSPTGVVERDTVRIILADHRGKWLGHGLGSKFDTRLFLKQNIRFPVVGTYIIEYEQGMRDEPLTGIEDVGLRIEKAE